MSKHPWSGLYCAFHEDVYRPGDDTYLLATEVQRVVGPGTRFLEVGCGTGFVSMAAAQAGAKATATDVNPHAVRLAQHNARQNQLAVDVLRADLMAGLTGPFDVVAFNPPYLPTGPEDHVDGPLDLAFDGGPDGTAVVLRFVEQLAALEPRPLTVLVVHSSLAPAASLDTAMEGLGYRCRIVAEEKHFFESLQVRRYDLA